MLQDWPYTKSKHVTRPKTKGYARYMRVEGFHYAIGFHCFVQEKQEEKLQNKGLHAKDTGSRDRHYT